MSTKNRFSGTADHVIVSGDDAVEAVSLAAHQEIQLYLVTRCTSTAPMGGAAELRLLVGSATERI